MAQAPRQTGGNGAADFIRQIVSDPKNVPDVTLLSGYLGASSEEAHERLYLSPDLSNYVEIPKTAILYQAPLPKEQDSHGGVTVWVKKDAALQYKMASAAQALANYFAGAIAAGAQAAAVPGDFWHKSQPCGMTEVCGHFGGPPPTPLCTDVGCPPPTPGCTVGPGCPLTLPACTLTQQHTRCPGVTCGIDCTLFCTPQCPPTHHATCNRTPCPQVSCGIDCTVVGPGCTPQCTANCTLGCPTNQNQATCAPFCTQNAACFQTKVIQGCGGGGGSLPPGCSAGQDCTAGCTMVGVNCLHTAAGCTQAIGCTPGISLRGDCM
jgi:hypothetical protein